MELKDIVSISGMTGLHEVIAKRADGLIVRSLEEDKSKFVSNRVHVFTPLDSITIYTHKDNVELVKVLPEIKKQEKENPPVENNASNEAHKAYFKKILPDFDEEKVYVSDIKKLIKWYGILDKHKLLPEEKKETTEADPEVEKKEDTKPGASKSAGKKATKPKSGK